jgi:hypothetical protein
MNERETSNKFRLIILENPDIPEVYLVLHEGLSFEEATEIESMYRESGKTDLKVEEYYPDAKRLGRNPELH